MPRNRKKLAWGRSMRQSKSLTAVSIASDLGFDARVFDKDDVIRLLAVAVESEGGQTAFAKHDGINRVYLNMILTVIDPLVIRLRGLSGFARFISPKSRRRTRRSAL